MKKAILLALLVIALLPFATAQNATIRVGAFPNITHPQAMVGKANGYFDKAMGSNVKIDWKGFNAGPAAIEALFAGAIDMTYIGPNPAISGYVRSNGEALRVIAARPAAVLLWSFAMIQEFRSPKIFTEKKLPLHSWETPRMSHCVRG